MSPEELEKARCLMESHEAIKKQTGRALLAHIDEQAKQIESWRQACFLRTQVVGQVERENHKQQDQIATLKAALRQNSIERLLNDAGRFGIVLDVGTARRMAREQLARELPEIFEEDEI